jgi:hypothetical protein
MSAGYDPQRKNGADFAASNGEVFTIAMVHGEFESTSLNAQNIRYWAMGGRHKSTKLEKPGTMIVYPGSPQARSSKEPGLHGFKICRVDSAGKLRVQNVESDRVRWMPQKVAISEQVQIEELKNELGERALKIMADTTDQVVLCNWFLATDGDFNPAIRKKEWKSDLLEWLRDEFGRSDKGLWSVVLNVEAPNSLPIEWYEEDTLLGEYLRVTGRYQSDESLKLHLHEYMPQTVQGKVTAGMGQVSPARREDVLRKAALLGVEYLGKHKERVDPIELEV